MWLSERRIGCRPAGRAAVLAAALAVLAGCTAQPLYSSSVSPRAQAGASPSSTAVALTSVNVAPVQTRSAQEVRNELIFLLSGGRGNPSNAAYTVELSAYPYAESSTVTGTVGVEQAATSSVMTFVGQYTLREAATGRIIGTGSRRATAAFDNPRQPYATRRAAIDAENRAGRELAALLASAVAADLATGRNAEAASTK